MAVSLCWSRHESFGPKKCDFAFQVVQHSFKKWASKTLFKLGMWEDLEPKVVGSVVPKLPTMNWTELGLQLSSQLKNLVQGQHVGGANELWTRLLCNCVGRKSLFDRNTSMSEFLTPMVVFLKCYVILCAFLLHQTLVEEIHHHPIIVSASKKSISSIGNQLCAPTFISNISVNIAFILKFAGVLAYP